MLLFPTVILTLEREWALPYSELIALMFVGQVLFGLGALPAGWLADRWSAVPMMILFFFGAGAATVLAGFADGPVALAVALSLIGLFGSIYHPVGIAWLVRNSIRRGQAIGINGAVGAIGVAGAPLIAALLSDYVSWRAAFIVPGAASMLIGIALAVLWRMGLVADTRVDLVPHAEPSRQSAVRAFIVLTFTMTCVGLVGSTLVVVLPKVLSEGMPAFAGGGSVGVGTVLALAYLSSGLAQYAGGRLADRLGMKPVYIASVAALAPALLLTGWLGNGALVCAVVAAVFINVMQSPAENGLLVLYTPGRWRSTAYGVKFLLSLGISALSVPLIALMHDASGGFFSLFALLAGLVVLAAIAAVWLPQEKSRPGIR